MTLKSYLWGMRISTLLSFLAWMLVIWYVDPRSSGMVGPLLFYGIALLFLSSLLINFLTWSRRKMQGGDEIALAYLAVSFRQGILLAILAILLLVLQSFRVLTWWDGLLVAAGIFLVELYFLTRK